MLVAAWFVWQLRETQRGAIRYVRGFQWAREGFAEIFRRHTAVSFFFGLGTGTLWAFLPTFAEDLGVLTGLLCGAAHGFLYPALAALVADEAPPARRGAVIGVFSAIFLCGQAGGAFAFGGFAHALGYVLMWTVLGAAIAIDAVISMGLERPAVAPA